MLDVFRSSAEQQGAYDFLSNESIRAEAMLRAMEEATSALSLGGSSARGAANIRRPTAATDRTGSFVTWPFEIPVRPGMSTQCHCVTLCHCHDVAVSLCSSVPRYWPFEPAESVVPVSFSRCIDWHMTGKGARHLGWPRWRL